MITYFKSQKDLAEVLKSVIDDYWNFKLSEAELIKYLSQVYDNNKDKIVNEKGIASVLSQRLGKKRLNIFIKILKLEGEY